LRGLEAQNRGARDRCIYIHGTPEERRIGKPVSFGCIRMRSRDVIALYDRVHIGMHVTIVQRKIDDFAKPEEPSLVARSD
jgi:lipoprotein-anchoring transpeptidase ErfK/SrfK